MQAKRFTVISVDEEGTAEPCVWYRLAKTAQDAASEVADETSGQVVMLVYRGWLENELDK